MVKLNDLKKLEKYTELNLCECRIIQQDISEKGCMQYVLEKDGRYFYREEKDGIVLCCREMLLDWMPFGKYTVFAFTPDDLHIYQVETGRARIGHFNILQMDLDAIQPGMSCTYHGNTLEYIDETHISFDGKHVQVEADSGFVYQATKRKIRAADGAKGLYRFFEKVAEEGKHTSVPIFCTAWWQFFEQYSPKKI